MATSLWQRPGEEFGGREDVEDALELALADERVDGSDDHHLEFPPVKCHRHHFIFSHQQAVTKIDLQRAELRVLCDCGSSRERQN